MLRLHLWTAVVVGVLSLFFFGFLMFIGSGQSRTGAIEYSSPFVALLGVVILGIIFARMDHPKKKKEVSNTLIVIVVAGLVASWLVSTATGTCDLRVDGPCESIFTFGQSLLAVSGLFVIGIMIGLTSRLIWRVKK